MKIGFSTSSHLFSKLIRILTKSKASHAYFRFGIDNEEVVCHANGTGVNFDYYKTFIKKNSVVKEYELLLTQENEKKVIAYVISQLDKPYDKLAVVGFAWVLINKAFGRKIKNPIRNKSAYFCSELTLEALKIVNFKGLDSLDRETTTPEDLMEFMDKSSEATLL